MACSARSIACERRDVEALPALERCQLLRRARDPLGGRGHLLGIHGVGLDAGARVGLVVAGALERLFLVAHLDLEPLARARFLGDWPERFERVGLLFDVERGGVARLRQGSDGLGADEALELRLELADPLDVRLLAGKQVLGRRHVLQPERLELLGHVRFRLAQLLFHVGAAAQAAIDVDVAELLLQLVAPAQPQGDGREDRADDGDEEPDELQLGRDLEPTGRSGR